MGGVSEMLFSTAWREAMLCVCRGVEGGLGPGTHAPRVFTLQVQIHEDIGLLVVRAGQATPENTPPPVRLSVGEAHRKLEQWHHITRKSKAQAESRRSYRSDSPKLEAKTGAKQILGIGAPRDRPQLVPARIRRAPKVARCLLSPCTEARSPSERQCAA